MKDSDHIIQGPGYIAEKVDSGYAVTFDAGSHVPQDVTVILSEDEFQIIRNDPSSFDEIIVPNMEKQGIKVL